MEYFIADIIGFVPWICFFLARRDLRWEMIVMSVLAVPLGLFDLLYVPTYWQPVTFFHIPVGIEGIIFSFEIGGIAALSYAVVSKEILVKLHRHHKSLALLVLVAILPSLIFFKYLNLPNIAISMYGALLIGIAASLFIRKDLVRSTIIGATTFGVIYFLGLALWGTLLPQTRTWFALNNLPKIFILNVPLYEIIFGFLFAAYWGNIYEMIFGYRFK